MMVPREIPRHSKREYTDTNCDIAGRMGTISVIGAACGSIGGALSALALNTCSASTGALFGACATAVKLPIANELSNWTKKKVYEYFCNETEQHKRIIGTATLTLGYFIGTAFAYGVNKAAGLEIDSPKDALILSALSTVLGVGNSALAIGCLCCLSEIPRSAIDLIEEMRAYWNRPAPVIPEGDGGPIPAPPPVRRVRNGEPDIEAPPEGRLVAEPPDGPDIQPAPRQQPPGEADECILEIG